MLVQKAFVYSAPSIAMNTCFMIVLEDDLSIKQKKRGLTARASVFVDLIERYIDIQELDGAIVQELIEKIVVHQAKKTDGQRSQQIDIHYRFVGIL